MTARYTYACTLAWGGDVPTAEIEVECSYSVAWGSPETGRNGPPELYDPGGASCVEDIKILTVNGVAWADVRMLYFRSADEAHEALAEKLLSDHEIDMLAEAVDVEVGREEAAAEDRFERMREEMIEDDLDD